MNNVYLDKYQKAHGDIIKSLMKDAVLEYKELKDSCLYFNSTLMASFEKLLKNPYPQVMPFGYLLNIECFARKDGSPKTTHALLIALLGRQPTIQELVNARYRLKKLALDKPKCRISLMVAYLLLPMPPYQQQEEDNPFKRLAFYAQKLYREAFVEYPQAEENVLFFLLLIKKARIELFAETYYGLAKTLFVSQYRDSYFRLLLSSIACDLEALPGNKGEFCTLINWLVSICKQPLSIQDFNALLFYSKPNFERLFLALKHLVADSLTENIMPLEHYVEHFQLDLALSKKLFKQVYLQTRQGDPTDIPNIFGFENSWL